MMLKLRKIIEKAMEGSKEYLKTLYDVDESVDVYNDIVDFGAAYTINSNVMKLCTKCKLHIAASGTGWKIEEY